MCSLSDNSTDSNAVNDRLQGIDLNNTFIQTADKDYKRSFSLKHFNDIDNVLFKTSQTKTSILPPYPNNIIKEASICLKDASKVADIINIENSSSVHVGHVINITEQIVLNTEINQLQYDSKMKDNTNHFTMVDRMHWLAQPSVSELNYLKRPAKYVIICHTATEEGFTQAENTLKVRLMQTFHIESKGWADIGYNFCIGSDGNVYEGRGWFVVGTHTLNYNKYSVGIAFIGCFLKHLPPKTSLKRCQDLIEHGVKIGAIDPDYELLAHCQCIPFLSPGPRLFEEIKTWKNFNSQITNTIPCPLETK